MGRAPCCDKANVKKGPWSPDEDAKLKSFIEQNGTGGNWITLPSKAGLKRCGKSCRLRWINYLRPDIKHGSFSEDEEILIYKLHASIGSRWSLIAAQLPGRTDNDIKNYWNTRLKKKLGEKKSDLNCRQFSSSSDFGEKGEDSLSQITGRPVPLSSSGDALHILKAHHYDRSSSVDGTQVTEGGFRGMLMPIEADSVKPEMNDVNPQEHDRRLLIIESSLRNCISSHTSPASSCSGISTDRSSFAAPAHCAESPYTESLNHGEDQSNIQEAKVSSLLPVATSNTTSLLIPNALPGDMIPEVMDKFRIDDDAVLEEVMALDEHSDLRSYNVVKDECGAPAECGFDPTWWAALMVPSRIPRGIIPLRNGEPYLSSHLSLDSSYSKISYFNSNTCFGNIGGGSLADYQQMRFGNPNMDSTLWQISESR